MNRTTILIVLLLLSVFLCTCSDDNPVVVDQEQEEDPGDDDPGDDDPIPENHPPTIVSQPDTFVWMGETLELTARADDPDQDALTYYLVDFYTDPCPPIDATIDSETGLFQFVPQVSDSADRTFGFGVSDGRGGCDTTYFDVAIYEETGLEIIFRPPAPICCYAFDLDDEFLGVISARERTFLELEPGTYKIFVHYNFAHYNPVPSWMKYVKVIDRRTTRVILDWW